MRHRSLGDFVLAGEAAVLLLASRAAVRLLPFGVVGRALGQRRRSAAATRPQQGREQVVVRCCWAVEAADRRMPGTASCLNRAMAGQIMLRRRRVPAAVVFGIGSQDGEWRNHAWLEVGGRTVLGGPGTDQLARTVEYVGKARGRRHQSRSTSIPR